MGRLANALSVDLLGVDAFELWLAVVAIGCTALAIGGPVVVVEAVPRALRHVDRTGERRRAQRVADRGPAAVRRMAGRDRWAPFLLAVDLVIVMPISWLPLVADSTRFARQERGVFGATFAGTRSATLGSTFSARCWSCMRPRRPTLGLGRTIAELTSAVLILGLIVGEA